MSKLNQTVEFKNHIEPSEINEILKLDKLCYPMKLQGSYGSIYDRRNKNSRSFITARDDDKLVGYICFFPITDNLINLMLSSSTLQDDNITSTDILAYDEDRLYSLFIISIVIHPKLQGSSLAKLMADHLVQEIKQLSYSNKIGKIFATATSSKGKNFLEKTNFSKVSTLEDNYELYECSLENLLR